MCSSLDEANWLHRQAQRILECPHHHVIFTIPETLNVFWLMDTRLVAGILFDAVRDTLLQLLQHTSNWLGAKPGILATLHTWGNSLVLHPHIHTLVTAGGLGSDGRWKQPARNCLLPRKIVMRVFRGKFTHALDHAISSRQLKLRQGCSIDDAYAILRHAVATPWNVKVLPRVDAGTHILTYLAGYMKGGPISNSRIRQYDGTTVHFVVRDNRDPDPNGRPARKVTSLTRSEFIRRLLLHVPPRRLHTVRSWGLYARSTTRLLNRARQLRHQRPYTRVPRLHWTELWNTIDGEHPERCPRCGALLQQLQHFGPRSPPTPIQPQGTSHP